MSIKRLTLATVTAVALMSALWAPAAFATGPQFEAASYPASITGTLVADHKLSFWEGKAEVTCEAANFSGDTLTAPRDFLIPTASYSKCVGVKNGTAMQARIAMNGCNHVLNVDHQGITGIYRGGWDTYCGSAGAQVEAKLWSAGANPNVDPPVCAWGITPEQFSETDAYDDLMWSTYSDTVSFLAKDTTYERTAGKTLLCGPESGSDGTYKGQSWISASTGGFNISG